MIDSLPAPHSLPRSEESERAVLGGILIDPEQIGAVAGHLAAGDFYLERHQIIYTAMLDLHQGGTTIDTRTLQAKLEQLGRFDAVGGLAYLAGLDTDLPDIGRLAIYAGLVRERAVRRRLIQDAGQTIRDCMDGGVEAPAAIELARGRLDALAVNGHRDSTWRSAGSIVEALEAELAEGPRRSTPRVTYGLPSIDAMCSPEPGQLIVVGARPGTGKTALLLQTADHYAIEADNPACFFSFEMTSRELGARLISGRTGVPVRRLVTRELRLDDWKPVRRAAQEIKDSGLLIDDGVGLTLAEITTRARLEHKRRPYSLLLLDYIGLIPFAGKERPDLEIGAITTGLARLAKELGISIVAAAQLNRSASKERRKPMLSDLREGGGQEQDGNVVLLLHREPREDAPGLLADTGCIIIAKNRNGATGEVPIYFDGPRMRFREADTRHQASEERAWSA